MKRINCRASSPEQLSVAASSAEAVSYDDDDDVGGGRRYER